MDIESIVEVFRKEQAQTDNWLYQLSTGREHKRRKDSVEFDKRLKNIVLDYKEYEIFDYLKKISFILE
jgi:hypothetical protein